MGGAEDKFLHPAILKCRVRLQNDLVLQAFDMGGEQKLMRALGQDKETVVPDMHLLDLSVRRHLHSLLGVLLHVLDIYRLCFLRNVRSG